MIQHRRDIGGDEILVLAQTNYDRRALAYGDDLLRLVRRHDRQRVNASQVRNRSTNARLEIGFALIEILLDQVGDHFGVGFGDKGVVVGLKLVFERNEVLDDSVMNYDDASRTVAMRMRVFLRWASVSRPSCVADAVGPVQRF